MAFLPILHLPTAGVDVSLPGILLLGFVIGTLTGLFGVGGGFLLTPLLRVVFLVPYPVAVGSGLPMITLTSGYSAVKYFRRDQVDLKLGAIMALSAILGTRLGKMLMNALEAGTGSVTWMGRTVPVLDLTLNLCFVVLLGTLAIMIYRETHPGKAGGEEIETPLVEKLHFISLPPMLSFPASGIRPISLWIPLAGGVLIGTLTGLLGVGGGFVNFPLLVYVFGLPTIMAVGTSAMQIVFASAFGSFLYFCDGKVEWILVGVLVATSFVGARFGIWLAQRAGGRKLRRYFSLVLALGVLVVLYGIFFGA